VVLCSKVAGAAGYALGQKVFQAAHRSTTGNVTEVLAGGEWYEGQAHTDFPAQPVSFVMWTARHKPCGCG
jgi:hypothetical protein